MRLNFMPGARMLSTVTIKLIEPRMEAIPSRFKPIAQKSIALVLGSTPPLADNGA